jgi:hypothetical protein
MPELLAHGMLGQEGNAWKLLREGIVPLTSGLLTAKQVELGASARETGFGKKVEPANVCAPFAGSNPNQHRRR